MVLCNIVVAVFVRLCYNIVLILAGVIGMGVYRGKNFSPFASYPISASTTSVNQVVSQPTFSVGMPITPAQDLMVANNTSAAAFVAWGLTAQTATSSNVAVLPGEVAIFDMGTAATNVAILLSTGTGTVYISIGAGV